MIDTVSQLEPDEVRVYYAPSACVADPVQAERCLAMLSIEERERQARFFFEPDRQSYLAAHALTRGVLAELLGVAPAELCFLLGPHGRPELSYPDRQPRLRFNLSHTRGLVACAVTLEHAIGVDVEQLERRVEIDQLARSVFSEAERKALAGLSPERRRVRFFELWTLKESYIKAVGQGLALPLRSITLTLDSGQQPCIALGAPIADDGAEWWLHVREPVREYMLAVAVHASSVRLTVRELTPPWVR